MKTRASNFELLKIISMFFVVSLHVCTQSGISDSPVSMLDDILFTILSEFGRTACTVFVMASAWFLCDSDFKVERIIKIWTKTIVYVLIVYFLIYHSYIMPWYDFFPLGGGILWFISAYISMLLLSPVMNAVMAHCPDKYLGACVLLTGVPLLLYPTISLTDGLLGNNVVWFMWLYLLMGYLKKKDCRLARKRSVMLIIFLILCLLRLFPRIEVRWSGRILFMDALIPCLNWWRDVLWTVPSFLTALSLFFIFAGMDMKSSRVINFIGTHTLAIYILHQMPFFYDYLWNGIFHCRAYAAGSMEIPYLLFVILCVFTAASFVDLIFDRILFNPVFASLKNVFYKINTLFRM